jgi:hypothetical protein
MSLFKKDVILQLFVAPKLNNWLAWPLQFLNTSAGKPNCTHLLLVAERMVHPVVNTPVGPGSPHLLQRTFHS